MANFPPLKKYLLYCIDQLIDQYGLYGPFLDVGCGKGDVSAHLAKKQWVGVAVDESIEALIEAKIALAIHPGVEVANRSLFNQDGLFQTILAMDVIEHIEDDTEALRKICSLLPLGGHLILSVPSNPKEWRWDDDCFGHYRRYTEAELRKKLVAVGFSVLEIWDFTFPVFWLMRRVYTRIKTAPANLDLDKQDRTHKSSSQNPWEIPFISKLLSRDNSLWQSAYRWQFSHFRLRPNRGHEVIVLARKNG